MVSKQKIFASCELFYVDGEISAQSLVLAMVVTDLSSGGSFTRISTQQPSPFRAIIHTNQQMTVFLQKQAINGKCML